MSNPAPTRISAWRRETRAALIAERRQLSPDLHQRASQKIEDLLKDLLSSLPGQTLSAYWPFNAEVDLRSLMEHLRAEGRTVALPSVVGPRTSLEFLRWNSHAEMNPGVYDIPVPRVRDVVTPAIVITPLVGFDRDNYRLGYGGGFFDITLDAMRPRPQTIGVGFELSRLDTIHPAETDIPMDFIITESGIHHRKGASAQQPD